ncbi:hypothetical protein PHET_09104 [Paragonimus heterotremus]|uniref:non-specific serine/threonine protein kinase n=1 Tax=Paragonimus heterotremus TaxID=100268 RepID=A0A8J4TB08_9TREM|nr:hypothetical protein PHET_09104 [Paragonimus heterotremus]
MSGMLVASSTRVFAVTNCTRPRKYCDYEANICDGGMFVRVLWQFLRALSLNDLDDYQIVKKFKRGNYSKVFESINLGTNGKCVIKVLKPVKKNKVRRKTKSSEVLREITNVAN